MTAYTVDASVFLSAYSPHERHHEDSRRVLARLRETQEPIIVPGLLLPELAATVVRNQGDSERALRFADRVQRLPNLMLVAVDEVLARQAAYAAAEFRLRGSDAVYAALARRFGATLVTLDREQRERVGPPIMALYPGELLRALTEPTPS